MQKEEILRNMLLNKKIQKIILSFFVMVNFFIGAKVQAAANIWLENGSHKIRQDAITNNQNSISIKAAKNEFEPFQLVIKNIGDISMNNVDVSISDFTGVGTISNDNVTIFKEHYINVTQHSSADSLLGEMPDALLPKVDAYWHENRTTFPLTVESNRVQPIWFDVFVPKNAPPGNYTATVQLTENSEIIYTGTINLTVWDFELPATASLGSKFETSIGLEQGYSNVGWTSPNIMQDQMRWFLRAGLRHRITSSPYPIVKGTYNSNTKTWDGFSATRYNYSLAGYEDGTSGDIEYGNSKITYLGQDFGSIYSNLIALSGAPYHLSYCHDNTQTEPPQEYKDQFIALVQAYDANLTVAQKEKIFFLVVDEPGAGEVGCGDSNPQLDYNTSLWGANVLHQYGMKTTITKGLLPELVGGAIDQWRPWWGSVVGCNWQGCYDKRDSYAEEEARGANVWWYHGCGDGGSCNTAPGTSAANGRMNFHLDYGAMRARIAPWMAFKYDISGITLWATTAGLSKSAGYSGDPYVSIWTTNYWKNGDGMLWYPGVANAIYDVNTNPTGLNDGNGNAVATSGRGAHTPSIGGTHNIPIESIRIKMIREGMEDYEYLKILKDKGEEVYARNQIATFATNTYTFSEDENQLFSVRELLAEKIELLNGTQTQTTYSILNFVTLLSNWLKIGTVSNLNGDNLVNTRDLGIMMSKWE